MINVFSALVLLDYFIVETELDVRIQDESSFGWTDDSDERQINLIHFPEPVVLYAFYNAFYLSIELFLSDNCLGVL